MPSPAQTTVVHFPRPCPKCYAVTGMPSKAGTVAEQRTQMAVQCARCRHEWSIEITPPVVIVKPERRTDDNASSDWPAVDEAARPDDRREASEPSKRRLRVGLCGLLSSTDKAATITVLYSLDADRQAGRFRLMNPSSARPVWLVVGSELSLSGDDHVPMHIYVTGIRRPHNAGEDDDFAEFVVARQP